jgi:hypothetical protein
VNILGRPHSVLAAHCRRSVHPHRIACRRHNYRRWRPGEYTIRRLHKAEKAVLGAMPVALGIFAGSRLQSPSPDTHRNDEPLACTGAVTLYDVVGTNSSCNLADTYLELLLCILLRLMRIVMVEKLSLRHRLAHVGRPPALLDDSGCVLSSRSLPQLRAEMMEVAFHGHDTCCLCVEGLFIHHLRADHVLSVPGPLVQLLHGGLRRTGARAHAPSLADRQWSTGRGQSLLVPSTARLPCGRWDECLTSCWLIHLLEICTNDAVHINTRRPALHFAAFAPLSALLTVAVAVAWFQTLRFLHLHV